MNGHFLKTLTENLTKWNNFSLLNCYLKFSKKKLFAFLDILE